jgi:hypothetical protein
LKIRVRITYAELLDSSPGGPVGVGEGHVRRWRAIVARNVREPSKEIGVPRRGDVDRPHASPAHGSPPNIAASSRLSVISPTGKWNVCLWSPPVHERGNQRGIVAEPRQPLRPGNLSS